MSEDGENRMIGGKPVRRVSFDTRGIFAPGQFTPESQTPPPEPPENLDQQMWNTGGGLPGGARVQPQGMTPEQQAGTPAEHQVEVPVGNSIVREPTTAESQSQLVSEIAKAREKMAQRVSRWKALPEDQRAEPIERFLSAFKKLAQSKAGKLDEDSGGFFQKMAAQIAEVIDDKIIPGVEPFTKGVLILAFTDMALPPSLSVPLTKIIGDHLAGRIERNLSNGSSQLKKVFGVLDAEAKTPEDRGFVARLRAKLKAMHPDAEIPPPPDGDEVVPPDDTATEAETATPAESAEAAEAEDTLPSADEPESDEASEQVELSDDVIDAYMKYLSYGQTQRDRAEAYLRTHPMAVEYSKEIIRMRDEYGEEILFDAADYAIRALKNGLAPLHIEPSDAGKSRSWFLWHAAKLRFLKNNPDVQALMPNAGRYHPEDPLRAVDDTLPEDEAEKSQEAFREIILVMLGYEIYRHAQGNQELIESLADSSQDDAQKAEIQKLLSENVAPGASLSSYKLRRLGQLMIGMGVEESEDTEDTGGIIAPPEGPRGPEAEPGQNEDDGYFIERRDVTNEVISAKYEARATVLSLMSEEEKRHAFTDEGNEEFEDRLIKQAMLDVGATHGKVIEIEVLSNQPRYYLKYDVTNHEECEAHGERSQSIVVQLNRAGLLGNFTDDEVHIIRSFDARYLRKPETPELFHAKFKMLLDDAQGIVDGGPPDPTLTPERVQERFQDGYDRYKATLNRVMYTLIAGKVEGEDAKDTDSSATLANVIQKRLAELKTITKHPTYEATLLVPTSTQVNISRRDAVANITDVTRRDVLYGGRSMYVEYEEAVPLAKAISEDLIPTLEKIGYTVGFANKLRNTTHSSAKMEAIVGAAASADMTAIPEAIAQNEHVGFAMQEYIRALAQVTAEANNIPYSNFGGLNAGGLEAAEVLTLEGLMLHFPLKPPLATEEEITRKAQEVVEREQAQGRTRELEVEKQKIRNNETRRKKRYENDLELAVKVASGLHKGVGEFWSVLDATVGNDILTANMVEDDGTIGRARTFADSNSFVLQKLMEMKAVEGSRFGKEAGYALMGVASARYLGEGIDRNKRSKLSKILLDLDIVDTIDVRERGKAWEDSRRGNKVGKPDMTSHMEYLQRSRDMSEADRNGMTPELEAFYREYMGVNQLMHKIPGDIPRSGGWRVDNNDSLDNKFVLAYTAEAQGLHLQGMAMHEHVMARLSELGGDRLVVHYIGKNLEKLMDLDPDAIEIRDRYKAIKKRVTDAIADGSFAAQSEKSQDEMALEDITPVYNRAKDNARIRYIQKHVITKRLISNPEMALLFERRGFTPQAEDTLRHQMINLLQTRAIPNGELVATIDAQHRNYAIMYQCLPAFEVAIRALHNQQGGTPEEYQDRIFAYFKEKISSSHPVRIVEHGQPAVEYSPLKDILVGDTVEAKTTNMMRLFGQYQNALSNVHENDTLTRRFAEQVVLGIGNTDALLTSAGGFDYSKIQFDGNNTVKSASSGIEGNIELKKMMTSLETALLGLFTTGLESVKKVEDYEKIVTTLHDILDKYASAMSANPDEANVFYSRLAQIAVFSLREPVPGDRIPSVWFVGDTGQTGKGLNAEQRYNLLKALMRKRGVPERLCIIDPEKKTRLTPAQEQEMRDLDRLPDDDDHVIGATPLAMVWSAVTGQERIKSSRAKRAERLAHYNRGEAKTYSVNTAMVLAGVDVQANTMEYKEDRARLERDRKAAAEAAAK